MKRERITITVDTTILEAIDLLVDRQTLRNRSQTIEHLLKEGLALHELRHAFIFLEDQWTSQAFSHSILLFLQTGIRNFFIAVPNSNTNLQAELSLIIQQFQEQHPQQTFNHTFIPSDFGSGGAILLQQTALTQPFFLTWVGVTSLPLDSLIPFYTFHRQHHQTVSVVNWSDHIPLALVNPEIINQIPPGLTSIRSTVFPQSVKNGTVRGYPVG